VYYYPKQQAAQSKQETDIKTETVTETKTKIDSEIFLITNKESPLKIVLGNK